MKCEKCNNLLTGKQKRFCSQTCKKTFHVKRTRNEFKLKTGLSHQSIKGFKRKLLFINSFGGGCSLCGYNKNMSALEFHHLNSKEKLFNIDSRSISNLKMEKIKCEIMKCILVCSNCHHEIHNPN